MSGNGKGLATNSANVWPFPGVKSQMDFEVGLEVEWLEAEITLKSFLLSRLKLGDFEFGAHGFSIIFQSWYAISFLNLRIFKKSKPTFQKFFNILNEKFQHFSNFWVIFDIIRVYFRIIYAHNYWDSWDCSILGSWISSVALSGSLGSLGCSSGFFNSRLIGIFNLCLFRRCRFKSPCLTKHLMHRWQLNGLSPVWYLTCKSKADL